MHIKSRRLIASSLVLGCLTITAIGCNKPQPAYCHDMCGGGGSSSPAPMAPSAPPPVSAQPPRVMPPTQQPGMPGGGIPGGNLNGGIGGDVSRVNPHDPYAVVPKTGFAPVDAAVNATNAFNARNKHVEGEVNSIIESMDGPPPVKKPDGNLVPPSEWAAAFDKKIGELKAQQQSEIGTLKSLQTLKASGKVDPALVDSQIKSQLEKIGNTTKEIVSEQGRYNSFKAKHGM